MILKVVVSSITQNPSSRFIIYNFFYRFWPHGATGGKVIVLHFTLRLTLNVDIVIKKKLYIDKDNGVILI